MTRWLFFTIVSTTAVMTAGAIAAPAWAQTPQAPQAAPAAARQKSPPQPQQKQGLDYFLGTWRFAWAGRETPLNAGPRSGTATFTRIATDDFLEAQISGKSELGTSFKETWVAGWNAAQQTMAFREKFANGTEALSVGEWTTPLAIHVAVQPIRVGNAVWRLRRTYNIGAVHAFDVVDELSVDGSPFQRLGKGEFTRVLPGAVKP